MSYHSKNGLVGVSAAMMVLTIGAVGLRFYARKTQRLSFRADDIFAGLAFVTFVAALIELFVMIHKKLVGYPYADLDKHYLEAEAETDIMYQLTEADMIMITLGFTKLSCVLFYRRIFCIPGRRGWFDIASLITIPVVVIWTLLFILLGWFECGTHFSAMWRPTRVNYCGIDFPMQIGMVVTDLAIDLWLIVLPVPSIMKLQTSRSTKFSIMGVFLMAFVGLAGSIGRVVIYIKVMHRGTAYAAEHYDTGVIMTEGFFFNILETGMTLVAINLPSLWLLRTKIMPEKWLRDLRSVISLTSVRSRRSSKDTSAEEELAIHKNMTTAVIHHNANYCASSQDAMPPSHGQEDVEAWPVEHVDVKAYH